MKHEYENIVLNAKRYFNRYANREAFSWVRLIRYYAIVTPLIICGLVAIFIYVMPSTPKNAYLAVGQVGSSYTVLAKKFQNVFQEHGLKLEVIETGGLVGGLRDLNDPKSKVNASFLTSGSASVEDFPDLVSLGSIQYTPMWIFYRGKTLNIDDPMEYFAYKRVGIGSEESVSNKIFHKVLELNHKPSKANFAFSELPHIETAKMLQEGKLDAVFIVDSYRAPVVQLLLNDPNIKIMNINLADAYVKQFPFLEKLTIPKGALNIENVIPREEVTLLGTTTNLLIEKDTHPAIQWAFMLAASEVGRFTSDFFSKPGTFPKYVDLNFPLSPIAKRYYSQGMPTVFEYMPLWLASLVDHAWVVILAFLALIYPLYKWVMSMRSYPSKMFMYRLFINLRDLDEDVGKIQTKEDALIARKRLDYLANLNTRQWLSETEARFYFILKNALQSVQKQIDDKLASFDKPSDDKK